MDYLIYFQDQFNEDLVEIRQKYTGDPENLDVVSDLTINNHKVALACLPVGKHIMSADFIEFKIPKIGDLFIGIQHQKIIKNVQFIVNNHTEVLTIDGILNEKKNIWSLTNLPIPLVCITDYKNLFIETKITFNSKLSTPKIFNAYYGYLQDTLKHKIKTSKLYDLELLATDKCRFKIVCGIPHVN